MSQKSPMLHMVCGKIASGKSTLCAKLGASAGTIVISEDDWLSALFADQMKDGADYVRYASKLRTAMVPHVSALLNAGLTVVLDFAANTVAQRKWMLDVARASNAGHQLHYLDVPDTVCLERLRARNAEGNHAFAATEEQFRRFTAHFLPPTEDEGFNIVHH
ncbi:MULTISPECIES: ATP-binding protein [Roseobacter]|uniref:AAA family ATPase n=1 Tax=Roseobacter TaxID=2433 RepID=UPI001BC4F7CE|nr:MULTISPECIES: ATP-binding protein [Roseobacter]GIT86613.1 cell division protein ZipA [Roseobacter sp. OBYS 0001]